VKIKELPFFYKAHTKPDNGGESHILPFNLYYDDKLKMFRQKSYPKLNSTLKKVYEEGTLVDGSLSSESGKVYLEKILDFVLSTIDVKGKKILDVGCGDGTMLIALNKQGANTIGIEPGSHKKNSDIGNIPIIRDFFPSKKINNKFDLIFSYGVLEHIENFDNFISGLKKTIKPDGKIVICVPNCEVFLEHGDVSIFIHEHFNYFTRESLKKVMHENDLYIEKIEIIEGMICSVITPSSKFPNKINYTFNLHGFDDSMVYYHDKIQNIFNSYQTKDIAIYVPARALNILFQLGYNNPRLIDDNTQVYQKFLPFFSNSIENFNDLLKTPPECLIIFSRTFGDRIKEKCLKYDQFSQTKIISLNEL